jgi:hypothetical protein
MKMRPARSSVGSSRCSQSSEGRLRTARGRSRRQIAYHVGLILMPHKPRSAKGEGETGVSNLVIWPFLYERRSRIILAAALIAGEAPSARAKSST